MSLPSESSVDLPIAIDRLAPPARLPCASRQCNHAVSELGTVSRAGQPARGHASSSPHTTRTFLVSPSCAFPRRIVTGSPYVSRPAFDVHRSSFSTTRCSCLSIIRSEDLFSDGAFTL